MRVVIIDGGMGTGSIVSMLATQQVECTLVSSHTHVKDIESQLKKARPQLVIIGPRSPSNGSQNATPALVRSLAGSVPLFGIGSGHLDIIKAFDGRVGRCHAPVLGRAVRVKHDGQSLFKGLSQPLIAARYNTLAGIEIPYEFEVSARDELDVVMAIRHKQLPIESVQFHPESILTPDGTQILMNVLSSVKK